MGAFGETIEKNSEAYFSEVLKEEESLQLLMSLSLLLTFAVAFLITVLIVRAMDRSLKEVSQNLESSSTEIRSMSSQLEAASTSLSSSSTQQAAAIQQTASAIEEISAMVKKSTEGASEARDVAHKAQEEAKLGGSAMSTMVETIQTLEQKNQAFLDEVNEGNKRLGDIVKVIQEIGAKTEVIHDIVFKTTLLSFNASVEAARAGEHGRGFAVVAQEVGALAANSGNAAKEISDLLRESQQKVQSIVSESKTRVNATAGDVQKSVADGVEVAGRCSDILSRIVSQAEAVAEKVNEVTVAATEQSKGVSEVSSAIHQLDSATQANARAAQGTSQTAGALTSQVDMLTKSSAALSELVDGHAVGRTIKTTHLSKSDHRDTPLDSLRAA